MINTSNTNYDRIVKQYYTINDELTKRRSSKKETNKNNFNNKNNEEENNNKLKQRNSDNKINYKFKPSDLILLLPILLVFFSGER